MRLCPFLILMVLLTSSVVAAPPRPASDRVDAVVGQPIVLRLAVDREDDLRDGLLVKMDDARTIECPVFWVGLTPAVVSRLSWTRPPPTAEAIPIRKALLTDLKDRAPGAWHTLIAIPLDAVGQGIWIEGERYDLNWLPDPERALLEAQGRNIDAFFSPAIDQGTRNQPAVNNAIEQFATSPFTRWRTRLIIDGLNPAMKFTPLDSQRPEEYLAELATEVIDTSTSQTFIEALAHQYEIRWQIILGRIWLIDAELADRLKQTLSRVVQIENELLPLWPNDQLTLDELAHDLLSPWVDDELRAKRARAWLDTLPRAAAWVIDDLGTFQPEIQKFTPTVGIISLPPEHGDTLVRLDAPGAQTTLTTIGDQSMHVLKVSTPPASTIRGQTMVPTHQLRIRLGRTELVRTAVSSPIEASPPGVRLGPLHRDWTMDALLNANPSAVAPMVLTRTTAGVLHRSAPPDEPDGRAGWTVYIECATPNPTSQSDTITLWVGPYSHPLAAWTINAAGEANLIAGSVLNIGNPRVQIATLGDRWSAQIELPREAIGDDLLLAIGLERTDAEGYHSAWPRRMIPGQGEPSRLIIDVSTWDGFRQPSRP